VEDAKEKCIVEESFWISGNGGAALCAGEFAQTSFASKAANTSAPVAELPGGQRLSAGAGTLLEVTTRKGVIRVFVRDSSTQNSNGVDDSKEEKVVYLGLFCIDRATFGSDELSTVIQDSSRMNLPIAVQRFMQFWLEFHYKFYLEPITPTTFIARLPIFYSQCPETTVLFPVPAPASALPPAVPMPPFPQPHTPPATVTNVKLPNFYGLYNCI
jgi:hypothetical protein